MLAPSSPSYYHGAMEVEAVKSWSLLLIYYGKGNGWECWPRAYNNHNCLVQTAVAVAVLVPLIPV
jgi:hypothetical protein